MTSSSDRRRPRPGDVLPYRFLFSDQADAGREEGIKERPCVVVLAVGEGERPQVVVAPVTTRPPVDPDAVPLSAEAFGGDRPSWILPWELNVFRWTGPDVGRARRPAGAWWRIGVLEPRLQKVLAGRVRARLEARRARLLERSE